MRVLEKIERSGFFWLPGKDDYKAPGVLRISDGGKISLEIVGNFSGPTGSPEDLQQSLNIGRVVGHVEKSGLVTLEDCFYTKRNYAFGGITKSQITVNWAVLGVAFDAEEEILFDEFTASIEGLEHWVSQSGISISLSSDFKSCVIKYKLPASRKLVVEDGLSVTAQFGYTAPMMGAQIMKAEITERVFLKVSTTELKKPAFFQGIVNRLKDFLSFAVDETVSLHNVSATNSQVAIDIGNGASRPANMDLYYGAINHIDVLPKLNADRMLFRYSDIAASPEKILSSWLSLYETIEPVMNLYFASKAGAYKPLEGRFLTLAQALETLHRRTSSETVMSQDQFEKLRDMLVGGCPEQHKDWLQQRIAYGNDVSLRRRLISLL